MKIYEFSCRLCLINTETEGNKLQWHSLEEKNVENDLKICDKISLVTGIFIDLQKQFAKRICKPCNETLQLAFDFRKSCISNDIKLKEYITKYKLDNINPKENLVTKTFNDCELEKLYPDIKLESNESETNYRQNIKECQTINISKSNNPNSTVKLKQTKSHERKMKVWFKKNSEENNARQKQDEKECYVCELCGNVYKKKALLSDHMKWHSGQKEFQCEICEKTFLLPTYLARHMRTHTGIRNFQCGYCSRTFYTNGLKRAHEKVHTGERQYVCSLCSRTFSYSQSLQRHLMVHSGVKPFKCDDCGKEFRQETHLKQHLSTNIHQVKTSTSLLNN